MVENCGGSSARPLGAFSLGGLIDVKDPSFTPVSLCHRRPVSRPLAWALPFSAWFPSPGSVFSSTFNCSPLKRAFWPVGKQTGCHFSFFPVLTYPLSVCVAPGASPDMFRVSVYSSLK